MLTGLTVGFALGAILVVLIGIVKKDIALWLSIGVGAGMSLGIILGWLSEKNNKPTSKNSNDNGYKTRKGCSFTPVSVKRFILNKPHSIKKGII